jgi:hypothetical protein
MLRPIDCHPMDQIFTHTDPAGVTRHFNASMMTRAVLARQVTPDLGEFELTDELGGHVAANHGIEEHHLETITDKMLESPVLMVHFEDGTDLIVDGSHRLVKKWRRGDKTVHALVFMPGQWERFLVDFGRDLSLTEIKTAIDKYR